MRIIGAALLALVAVVQPSAAAETDPERLFLETCGTCHFARRDPARMSEMVAPPMDMMSAHVRAAIGDDRDTFIAWVLDWVRAPSEQKSVDAMAIQRFGLMPPIGDTFPDLKDEDIKAVAGWIYDTYKNVQLPPMRQRMQWQRQMGVPPH